MKNIIKLITLAALLIAVPVQAQYSVSAAQATSLTGGTNKVDGLTTNTYAIVIDIHRQSYTGFMVNAKYNDTCTGTALFSFSRSLDGSNYETTPGITLRTAAGNSATAVLTFGTQQVDGIHSLKLVSVGNTNAAALTNITFHYLIKR